eukprot:TRINITY_DN1482_c1_g1_i1.p1 TRINITY_DN1482_c1_g1~~TRINITY_DN1482_c1_g1_i1.p1  ORF type:complete len:100 (+),score=0.55 TRINITY_DN1482_c1_g1_i1:228-527(+)
MKVNIKKKRQTLGFLGHVASIMPLRVILDIRFLGHCAQYTFNFHTHLVGQWFQWMLLPPIYTAQETIQNLKLTSSWNFVQDNFFENNQQNTPSFLFPSL